MPYLLFEFYSPKFGNWGINIEPLNILFCLTFRCSWCTSYTRSLLTAKYSIAGWFWWSDNFCEPIAMEDDFMLGHDSIGLLFQSLKIEPYLSYMLTYSSIKDSFVSQIKVLMFSGNSATQIEYNIADWVLFYV